MRGKISAMMASTDGGSRGRTLLRVNGMVRRREKMVGREVVVFIVVVWNEGMCAVEKCWEVQREIYKKMVEKEWRCK